MPFLAEALDRSGHDRVFERALDRAVRLMHPDAEARAGQAAQGAHRDRDARGGIAVTKQEHEREEQLMGLGDAAEGRPTILVADGPEATSRLAADLLVAWLAGAIGERGVAHVALTGGSSAKGLYAALREPSRSLALDWGRVHAWIGDDRFVPLVHPDSNGGLALRELAGDGTGILPASNLHLVPVEAAMNAGTGPDGAAAAYAGRDPGPGPLLVRGARCWTWCCWAWAATATCCRSSRAAPRWPPTRRSRWASRRRRTSSRTCRG